MHANDFKTWSGAILIAGLIHGLMFMQAGNMSGVMSPGVESLVHTTRLRFKQVVTKTPDKKIIEPDQPVPITESTSKPEPVEKKRILKTSRKSVAKPKTDIHKNTAAIRPPANTASASTGEKQNIDIPTVADQLWIKQQRDLYFSHLIGHIEKYKFYPGSARRRGITGKVSVSFHLTNDGDITGLKIVSQHRVLKLAAAQALESALPMPLPEKGVLNSREIKFNMLYAMH